MSQTSLVLNLGSGRDWREDCLNADIERRVKSDWCLDIQDVHWGSLLVTRLGDFYVKRGMFDKIIANDVLEHVPDSSSVVRACAQLVKPGGWVFFSTLNRNLKSFMLAIVGAEYVLNMLPKGTHEYAKFIRPSELASHCRHAGLDVLHSRGMSYNPITRRYWLNDDTSVNYLIATRRPL